MSDEPLANLLARMQLNGNSSQLRNEGDFQAALMLYLSEHGWRVLVIAAVSSKPNSFLRAALYLRLQGRC